MSDEEHQFESIRVVGASKTYPHGAGSIRKNGYLDIKDRPCKMASGPPRGSMSQDRVFYTKEWTREVDGVFIRALVEQTIEGNLVYYGQPNRHGILFGMMKINRQFGKDFDYNFCLDRFHKLYKHFKVFNWIIKQPGVLHYPLNHDLDCDDAAWNAICRHDALGLAYMRKGEEEFDNLQYLFTAAHESNSGEDEREVINISSDPDEVSNTTDEADDGHTNAFSYELAWYTSPTKSNNSASSASTFSGASSNMRKVSGNRLSAKRPPLPRAPTGSGPSSVASSSPLK